MLSLCQSPPHVNLTVVFASEGVPWKAQSGMKCGWALWAFSRWAGSKSRGPLLVAARPVLTKAVDFKGYYRVRREGIGMAQLVTVPGSWLSSSRSGCFFWVNLLCIISCMHLVTLRVLKKLVLFLVAVMVDFNTFLPPAPLHRAFPFTHTPLCSFINPWNSIKSEKKILLFNFVAFGWRLTTCWEV